MKPVRFIDSFDDLVFVFHFKIPYYDLLSILLTFPR